MGPAFVSKVAKYGNPNDELILTTPSCKTLIIDIYIPGTDSAPIWIKQMNVAAEELEEVQSTKYKIYI